MARELGLTPSANDPTVTCILADGHTIKCKVVYAKTVRVGKFTVDHVECGVMPADCLEAGRDCWASPSSSISPSASTMPTAS